MNTIEGRPYQGWHSQYGLELHWGVDELLGGGANVYNHYDGCIWASYAPEKNINGYDFGVYKAHQCCEAWNGANGARVDIAAIDGTP